MLTADIELHRKRREITEKTRESHANLSAVVVPSADCESKTYLGNVSALLFVYIKCIPFRAEEQVLV